MELCQRCNKKIFAKHRSNKKGLCPACSSLYLMEEITKINQKTTQIYYKKRKLREVEVNEMLTAKLATAKATLEKLNAAEVYLNSSKYII